MTLKKPGNTKSEKPATKTTSPKEPTNAEELQFMISEAAYYRAESRGFASGSELEDWQEAEKQINEMTA